MKLSRILRYGMVGKDIKHFQNKLIDLKYMESNADGNFGPLTLKSIKKFQKDKGVTVDGIVGPQTWRVLFNTTVPKNVDPIKVKPKSKSKFNLDPNEVTDNGLEIYNQIMNDLEYVKKVTKKKVIYLHHTAGSHRPDWVISGWDKADSNGKRVRVGTHYVIGRESIDGDLTWDGKVFRAFEDKYWAYHLGAGGDVRNSEAIGIEITNYGYLTKNDKGEFINYVGSTIPQSNVVDLGEEWRGYRYFQKYTNGQIESLRKLIIYLIDKHDIEIEKGIYNINWFEYDSKFLEKGQKGIRTHVNVRKDKTDCFPQKELIDMLNSL